MGLQAYKANTLHALSYVPSPYASLFAAHPVPASVYEFPSARMPVGSVWQRPQGNRSCVCVRGASLLLNLKANLTKQNKLLSVSLAGGFQFVFGAI